MQSSIEVSHTVTDPVPHHMELDLATQDYGIAAPSKCLPHGDYFKLLFWSF